MPLQQIVKKPPSERLQLQHTNGHATDTSDFAPFVRAYAQARLQRRLLPPQHPKAHELELLMKTLETEVANSGASPEEQRFLAGWVNREEQRMWQQHRTASRQEAEQSKEMQMADALRRRQTVAKEATKGIFGEKDGLSLENYEKLTDGKSKTITLATGRARVDDEKLQQWANSIGPQLKLKKGTPWRQVLDNFDEMRMARPEAFAREMEARKLDPAFMEQTLKDWSTQSIALGWAEKLNAKDDEAGIPHEEDVPITDDHRRHATVTKVVTDTLAERAAAGDESAVDELEGAISDRYRDDAVRETLRLRQQDESHGDEVGLRDALIRAYDTHEGSADDNDDGENDG